MDTAGTTTTVVNNSGTIIGISVEGLQSGDAVDVDGLITLNNHGSIQALGTRTGGLPEGVTVGGGTINNYADGTIVSSQRAITIDGGGNTDGTTNPAFAAATILNEGLIQGDNGEAIVIVGGFADTISNHGTIIGSIATDAGNDMLNLETGSSISGLIDGGDSGRFIALHIRKRRRAELLNQAMSTTPRRRRNCSRPGPGTSRPHAALRPAPCQF
jgi:hypothetical protein